jgi:hypothetical protein
MQTVSFATARRGTDGESLSIAKGLLNKGYGYQNAARISGVNECLLRELYGTAKRRASVAVPWTPARLPKPVVRVKPHVPAEFVPACADDTTAILDRVAKKYGLTRRDLLGGSRCRHIAWPRQEAMAAIRAERRHLSYPAIARIFGGRDHTTIMHGEARHLERAAWCDVMTVFAAFSVQPDLFARAA